MSKPISVDHTRNMYTPDVAYIDKMENTIHYGTCSGGSTLAVTCLFLFMIIIFYAFIRYMLKNQVSDTYCNFSIKKIC